MSATGRAAPWALILGLAVLSHAWVLPLPFALDDYSHVAVAPASLGLAAPAPGGGGVSAEQVADPEAAAAPTYLFRPAFWGLLTAVQALGPRPVVPRPFHVASLLLHVLVTLVGYALLGRWLPHPAALVGGAFLAVHPGGAQAVSWIAAGSDLLLTLATLLGVAIAVATRGLPGAVVAGVCVAVAVLSKVSAFVSIPLVGLALLLARRSAPRGRLLRDGAAFAVPVIAAVLWRQLSLGTWSLTYAGGSRAGPGALPAALAKLPDFLVSALAPVNEHAAVEGLRPVSHDLVAAVVSGVPPRVVLALLVGLPVLAGLLLAPRRVAPGVLVAGLAFVLLSLPALFLYPEPPEGIPRDNTLGRIFYSGRPALAAAFACAAAGVLGRPRRRRVLAGAVVIAALVSTDLLVHVARTERLAARHLTQRIEAVEAALEGPEPPTVVVVDPEGSFAGIPLLREMVRTAFLPPFRAEAAPVLHAASETALIDSGLLARIPGPVRVLGLEEGRLVPRGPQLVALPATLPALVPIGGVQRAWRPATPVPPRAVAGLRCTLPPGPPFAVEVRLETDGPEIRRHLRLGASDAPRPFDLLVGPEPEWIAWLLAGRLERVRLFGEGAVLDALPEPPRLLAETVPLELRAPAPDAALSLGTVPSCTVAGVPEGRPLRFRFDILQEALRVPMVFVVPPSRLERGPDGSASWRWKEGDSTEGPFAGIHWGTLPALWAEHLAPLGVRALRLRWRAELLHTDGVSVEARSAWRGLRVVAGD